MLHWKIPFTVFVNILNGFSFVVYLKYLHTSIYKTIIIIKSIIIKLIVFYKDLLITPFLTSSINLLSTVFEFHTRVGKLQVHNNVVKIQVAVFWGLALCNIDYLYLSNRCCLKVCSYFQSGFVYLIGKLNWDEELTCLRLELQSLDFETGHCIKKYLFCLWNFDLEILNQGLEDVYSLSMIFSSYICLCSINSM